MGLDMYLKKAQGVITLEDFEEGKVNWGALEVEEVGYFRKHADLNEYFTKLYHERSKVKEEFNCTPLPLSREDIEEVVELSKKALEGEEVFDHGEGFFWGETEPENHKEAIEVFSEVLNNTDFENETIIYECWY